MAGKNIIFGIRTCIEAITSGKEIEKVLLKTGSGGSLFQELFKLINKNKIPFQYVPVEKLDRITGKNHQGVISFISEINYHNVEQLVPSIFERGEIPLLLILDGITDVRNFGAIARTALCAGVHGMIIPVKRSAQINADAIKTSAGALLEIPVCRTDKPADTIIFLRESGIQVIASNEKAGDLYYNTDLLLPTAFIIGAEDIGISEASLKLCDTQVKIPVDKKIGSLNVSVTAGILVYEALRQRQLS